MGNRTQVGLEAT